MNRCYQGLKLVDEAPCGARGVIAVKDISLDEVSSRPLMLIPAAMELNLEKALEVLEPLVPARCADTNRITSEFTRFSNI